jgi:hypothetical protein
VCYGVWGNLLIVTDLQGNKENHNTASYVLHVFNYMCWVLKRFVDCIIESPVK